MNAEAWHWPKTQALTEAYLHQYDYVQSLFEYHPWQQDTWTKRMLWLDSDQRPQANRTQLAEAVAHYNRQIGAPESAIQAAESLSDPRALTIVGGQQAGLFTGPLLVIWKAITVIQTARDAAIQLKRPVIPIFWIAGEDHDWEEVNHIHLITQDRRIEKYRIPDPPGASKRSVSHVEVNNDIWEAALKKLSRSLPDTAFKAELLETLTVFACHSRSLSDYFARMMSWLFGHYGLVLIDAADPQIRRLESEMFKQLIVRHQEVNDQLLKASEHVEMLGYPLQAPVTSDQANLFLIGKDDERLLLSPHSQGLADRKGHIYTEGQLLTIAERSPERLSTNVFTRPIMQEYILPALGTVLGPAEIAYWAQLKRVFSLFKMQMPILIPRYEYTLIDETSQKYMQHYGMTFEDVVLQFDAKKQAWLNERDDARFEEQFAELKQSFIALYEPLLASIYAVDQGLRPLGETNKRKIMEQLDFMCKRAIGSQQQRFDTALRQMDHIATSLMPLGKPQERMYNIIMLLNQYGLTWLDQMVTTPPADAKLHNLVYL